jgi:hypothetical protein
VSTEDQSIGFTEGIANARLLAIEAITKATGESS